MAKRRKARLANNEDGGYLRTDPDGKARAISTNFRMAWRKIERD